MKKSDLAASVAEAMPHLPRHEIYEAVSLVFREIAAALEEGERVEVRGFGAFSVRSRAPRRGRNPMSGEEVLVPTRRHPHFSAGQAMIGRLNPHLSSSKDTSEASP